MKRTLILALTCAMTTSVFAQTASGGGSAKKSRGASSDIQELKDAVAAQQEQIKQLQQQIQTRDQAIQQLQGEISNLPKPAPPPPPGPDYGPDINNLQGEMKDLKAGEANVVDSLTETQKRIGELEAPLAIHYKGITITPGGFLAGESVWRQRATLGDINTQFNGTPFSAQGQARQTEWYGSGRQSRFSMLMQGKWGDTNLTGYYEMDFLGAGVTSNNNESNSYVMRQRQVWGQAAFHNGWTVTTGQMWSLVAETRKGLDPRTEALPLQIDAQYVVGLSWARQFGFRVTKNFNNRFWAGFSVENGQELLSARNTTANFLVGGPGNCGGLYNCAATFNGYQTVVTAVGPPVTTAGLLAASTVNYSSNIAPDVIGKLAFEPKFGGHYEAYVVASIFRDRIYPNAPTNATGAFNNTETGFGVGANARWLVAKKKVELGAHFLGGNGIERYGTSTLPDVTVDSRGYQHVLRGYQGLLTTEYHLPKWDFYGYGGVEYVNNAAYKNASGVYVGYGSATNNTSGCWQETLPAAANGFGPGALANCAADTRAIYEGTFGFWYKPYNGPKGRLQMGLQYSYLSRDTWRGLGKAPFLAPEAINNMVFTSFRYYLP
jgi:uncharacterized coiled-coil protein SlyX